MVESLILMYGHGFFFISKTLIMQVGLLASEWIPENEVLIRENHKKDKDDLLNTIGIENVKATIFWTDLTFLTPKLTNYQSNL